MSTDERRQLVQRAFAEPAWPVDLTFAEVCYLSDSVHNDDIDEGDPEKHPDSVEPIARGLLEKVGSLYLSMAPTDHKTLGSAAVMHSAALVFLTVKEAWLIREVTSVDATAYDNSTNVGVELLRKAYGVIMRAAETGIEATAEDQPALTPERIASLGQSLRDRESWEVQ